MAGKGRGSRCVNRRGFRGPALLFFVGYLTLLCGPAVRAAGPATIKFSLSFPGSDPARYTIVVRSDGQATYECSGRVSQESDDYEDYQTQFNFSDAARVRIFELAAQAHYFSGKVDSGNRKLAFTGAKKLVYTDGQKNSSADYNFSPVPAVQQLTTMFQSVSATLEFGRRLAHFHRYQKLALDEELKRMEVQAREGQLIELQAVKPVLQEIYDDTSVINVVRARAQRLMEMPPAPLTGR